MSARWVAQWKIEPAGIGTTQDVQRGRPSVRNLGAMALVAAPNGQADPASRGKGPGDWQQRERQSCRFTWR